MAAEAHDYIVALNSTIQGSYASFCLQNIDYLHHNIRTYSMSSRPGRQVPLSLVADQHSLWLDRADAATGYEWISTFWGFGFAAYGCILAMALRNMATVSVRVQGAS